VKPKRKRRERGRNQEPTDWISEQRGNSDCQQKERTAGGQQGARYEERPPSVDIVGRGSESGGLHAKTEPFRAIRMMQLPRMEFPD
jgi:hypothetical protein